MLFASSGYSQGYVAGKSFVKDHSVYLRWVTSDYSTFKHSLKNGFVLKRIPWNSGKLPDSTDFRNSTTIIYKHSLEETNPAWKLKIEQKNENAFLYSALYNKNSKNVKNEQYFYSLAMLACDHDTSLAALCGLFFIDKNVDEEKVAYMISPSSIDKGIKISPAFLLVATGQNDLLPNPDSLSAKAYKKEIRVKWPEEIYKSYYTGYYIERSEDGINYTQLNKTPHTQIKTKDDKKKTELIFIDTSVIYNTTYFYKVRGLNFFGVLSNYSNVYKARANKPFFAELALDSVNVYSDTLQRIVYHLNGKHSSNELKGFAIYRAKNDTGTYKRINNELVLSNYYVDRFPISRAYYKVVAYNVSGDSTTSFSGMGLLPDVKPPSVPKNLTGVIDSSGTVTLRWLQNKDSDLKGYRIFRCNDINEEPVEITAKIFTDTLFKDRVALNTLTEKVIYYITSVDNVYNNSKYTTPLILARPDTIKPVPVVFNSINYNDSSIIISWINSSSKDISHYQLFQIDGNGSIRKMKEWFRQDTLSRFTDYNIHHNNFYSYKIIAFDKNQNYSEALSKKLYCQSKPRKAMSELKYIIDKESKSILLEWQAPGEKVFSYVLYRSKGGQEYISYKTFKSNVLRFDDKDLNIGNTYYYKIKANFESGAESKLTNELKVEF